MTATDPFAEHYEELLDGTYDCVDRIILNGYCRLTCSPGGFRTWWRELFGSDDNLSNNVLQRMAGRFSRRLRAWAKKHAVPVVHCTRKDHERKHLIAEKYRPENPNATGLFLVIVGRAPGLVWNVVRGEGGKIVDIGRKNQSWVNHYSFHIMDPDWGHVTFKICGQPPFAAQIMLNGHEYVARQALKRGLVFTKEGNCFTSVSGGAELARIAGTLRSDNAIGHLTRLCDRWIYSSCLYFALTPEEQKRSRFHYDYSVYQLEYSRNLLFHRGGDLERVMQTMIDRTRSSLGIHRVRTLFGYKRRPKYRRKDQRQARFEAIVLEGPQYDLTVFKLNFGKLTLKAYTKGERVLRFEAVVHNTKVLRCRRSIPCFPHAVSCLREMVERFLQVLACVDLSLIRSDTWDQLRVPSRVGAVSVPGIDIGNTRLRLIIQAVITLAPTPGGFSINDLASKVRLMAPSTAYTPSQAAYDLRKLRGKGFVLKVPGSHRYACSTSGLQAMTALLVITDNVLRPVLAGIDRPSPSSTASPENPVDLHHWKLQQEMRNLFRTLGIAA